MAQSSLADTVSDRLREMEKKGLKEGVKCDVPSGNSAPLWTSLWVVLLMGIGRTLLDNLEHADETSASLSLEIKEPAGLTDLIEKLGLKGFEKCIELANSISESDSFTLCGAVLILMAMHVVTAGITE